MALAINTESFEPNGPIPERFTQVGENLSPNLYWQGEPANTQEYALIMEDPDAPNHHPFVHWVLYKIPAGVTRLPEGIPEGASPGTPPGAYHGDNTYGAKKYEGPKPPVGHGPHRYYFRLFALDTQLEVNLGLDRAALLEEMEGHVIEEAQLLGTFER